MKLRQRSAGIITTTTASETASSIVTGIYSPITAKIDPLRMGEMRRSMDIAIQYGVRLGSDREVVEHLAKNYPSHSFVIDFDEAEELFENVRPPARLEQFVITNLTDVFEDEYGVNYLEYVSDEELMGIVNISFEQSDGKEDGDEEKSDYKEDEDKIIHEEKATSLNPEDEKEI